MSLEHGTSAGYVAGCRDACCRVPRMKQQKATRYRVHKGVPTYRTKGEVDAIIAPWIRMGLTRAAIQDAAGVGSSHALKEARVLATTYDALAAVTEQDFADKASVFVDLTATRVYSLMAAGHLLKDMPISSNGVWRDRVRIRVSMAREMRDYYAAHENQMGTSRQTAARARNAGHLPPMAWDDPGTLAWPDGAAPKISARAVRPLKTDVDPVVVQRVLAGDRMPTTRAEKLAITAAWEQSGRTLKDLEHLMGWRSNRYTDRGNVA